MISRLHTVAFTFLASVSLALADWSGWYEPAYSNGSTLGVYRFASNGEVRANLYGAKWAQTYTNYTSPTRGFTNTATFTDGMWPEVLPWGSSATVLRAFYTSAYVTNQLSNTTFVVTNTLNLMPTSVLMQARDVWALDAIRATRERIAATGVDPWGSLLEADLYANNREALVYVKDSLDDIIPQYVNTSILTNRMQANYFTNVQMWTITGLLARVGAPTNYFEFTPWTELGGSGSDSNAFTPIMTQTFTQVCRSTNICTNIFRVGTMLGSISYLTNAATNGASVSLVTTNLGIAEGTNHLGYGWRYIRPILTNLYQTMPYSSIISTQRQARADYLRDGDGPNPTNTSDMCAYLWSAKDRQYANDVASWTWRAESALWYELAPALINAPFNMTNDADSAGMNIDFKYVPSFSYISWLSTNSASVITGMQPYVMLYESRTASDSSTNYFTGAVGWPFSVTTTVGYVINTQASGYASAVYDIGTNILYRTPSLSYLNVNDFYCSSAVPLPIDNSTPDIELFTDTADEDDWTSVEIIGFANFNYRLDFSFTVSQVQILDWTYGTNAFRYR